MNDAIKGSKDIQQFIMLGLKIQHFIKGNKGIQPNTVIVNLHIL
jgi:hypothetical protein